jgi:hypothetical protein
MCPEPTETNQIYRREARIIRAKASEVHDAEARAHLLLIASLFDKLADVSYILLPSLEATLSDNSRAEDLTGGTDDV